LNGNDARPVKYGFLLFVPTEMEQSCCGRLS
jgi:hypothetical protein